MIGNVINTVASTASIVSKVSDFLKNEKPCIFSEETGTSVILTPIMSQSKTGSVQVTDHAVEDGTTISDHVFKETELIELNAILSDSNDLLGQAVDSLKSWIGAGADSMSVQDKIELLEFWRDTGEIVTYSGPVWPGLFVTGYDMTKSSMLITDVSLSNTEETGSAVNIDISLKKVTIAEAVMKNAKLPTAARKVTKKGESSTQTEKVEPKRSSMLKKMAG